MQNPARQNANPETNKRDPRSRREFRVLGAPRIDVSCMQPTPQMPRSICTKRPSALSRLNLSRAREAIVLLLDIRVDIDSRSLAFFFHPFYGSF